MQNYRKLVEDAINSQNESKQENTQNLFELMFEDMIDGNFNNFCDFAKLTIYMSQEFWVDDHGGLPLLDQLFDLYGGIHNIDWIWQDSGFLSILPDFVQHDMHFGCYLLTLGRATENFIDNFSKKALNNFCHTCTSDFDNGWISAPVNVVENNLTSELILEEYFIFYNKRLNDPEYKIYAVEVLRALASNSKVSENTLIKLSKINEKSSGHERRMIFHGEPFEIAEKNSWINIKAIETINKKKESTIPL